MKSEYSGQPLTGNDQLCLSLSLQFGTWESEACFGYHPYICKVPSQSDEKQCTTRAPTKCRQQVTCPSGWTFFDLTKKCYKLVFNVRYYDVLALCESSNGTLASVHSAEENTMLGPHGRHDADLLGLHAPNGKDSDQWEWTDGSKVNYLNWGAGQGRKTSACVQITNDVASADPVQWMDHWYNDPCKTVHPAAISQREAVLS
ncbi:CLEC-50 protein [Aphelenchoides avenae]|nr:CLEC-50 protein [Aphelenchus avenae]